LAVRQANSEFLQVRQLALSQVRKYVVANPANLNAQVTTTFMLASGYSITCLGRCHEL